MPKYCRTRASAQKLGRLYYKTGQPCVRGHNALRYTSTGKCVECDRLVYKVSRRDAIRRQTPPWADKSKIQEIYDQSFDMGPDFHVDHIIPLQGELVSGLHCEQNLVIIPRDVNLRKRNFFEVI